MRSHVLTTAWCKRCMDEGGRHRTKLGEVTRTYHEITGWRTVWRPFERSWVRQQKQSDDPIPVARYGVTLAKDNDPGFTPRADGLAVECRRHGQGSVSVSDVLTDSDSVDLIW